MLFKFSIYNITVWKTSLIYYNIHTKNMSFKPYTSENITPVHLGFSNFLHSNL